MTRYASCCACNNKASSSTCTSIAERSCVLSPYYNHLCSNCTDFKDFTNDDVNDNHAKNKKERESAGNIIDDEQTGNDNDDDGEDSKSISLLQELEASQLHTEPADLMPNISYLSESSDDDNDLFGNNFQQAQPMFDDFDLQQFEKNREMDERIEESKFVDGLLFDSSDSSD